MYLTGGATAVLYGWRPTTIDIDMRINPERDEVQRAIPELKERFGINVEFASPADFIPVKDGWEDRSPFAIHCGQISVYHFELHAQALAKIERGHQRDLSDVRAMAERMLIDPELLVPYFEEIAPRLYKYPAIDPITFREAVIDFVNAERRRISRG